MVRAVQNEAQNGAATGRARGDEARGIGARASSPAASPLRALCLGLAASLALSGCSTIDRVSQSLGLTGEETIDILGLEEIKPRMDVTLVIHRPDGTEHRTTLLCRVDTADEVEYYRQGGILHYVLRSMAQAPQAA